MIPSVRRDYTRFSLEGGIVLSSIVRFHKARIACTSCTTELGMYVIDTFWNDNVIIDILFTYGDITWNKSSSFSAICCSDHKFMRVSGYCKRNCDLLQRL